MPITQKLLKILACPECKVGVEYDSKLDQLKCPKCKRKFKIIGNIPVMHPINHPAIQK